MSPKPSPIDGLRVGLTDAAKLIGKSIQHVRDLVRDGFVPEPVGGKYLVTDVASGALKARDAADRRASKSAADSRLRDIKAEEVQLRMDEKRKVQVAAGQAAAVHVIDEFFGGLKADLLAIPARVTLDVALRRKIEDGLYQAFGAAAKRAVHAADRIESAGTTIRSATAADDRRMDKAKPNIQAKHRRPRSS